MLIVSSSSSIHSQAMSGENAPALGLPVGFPTISSSFCISMGASSHALRKLLAIRRFGGRPGFFMATSVKAIALPIVMLGVTLRYSDFR